jgi:hypothetical protein
MPGTDDRGGKLLRLIPVGRARDPSLSTVRFVARRVNGAAYTIN